MTDESGITAWPLVPSPCVPWSLVTGFTVYYNPILPDLWFALLLGYFLERSRCQTSGNLVIN